MATSNRVGIVAVARKLARRLPAGKHVVLHSLRGDGEGPFFDLLSAILRRRRRGRSKTMQLVNDITPVSDSAHSNAERRAFLHQAGQDRPWRATNGGKSAVPLEYPGRIGTDTKCRPWRQ